MALVQALHLEASGSLGSLQKAQAFDGAAGASVMNLRPIRNTTKATTTKVMIVLMNVP
jgi:hypothetical protein